MKPPNAGKFGERQRGTYLDLTPYDRKQLDVACTCLDEAVRVAVPTRNDTGSMLDAEYLAKGAARMAELDAQIDWSDERRWRQRNDRPQQVRTRGPKQDKQIRMAEQEEAMRARQGKIKRPGPKPVIPAPKWNWINGGMQVIPFYELVREEVGFDFRQRGRQLHVVRARRICMWLARVVGGASLAGIGRFFDVDHTAALRAVEEMERNIQECPEARAELEAMRAKATTQLVTTKQQRAA